MTAKPQDNVLIADVAGSLAAELHGLSKSDVDKAVRLANRELDGQIVREELPEMLHVLARHRLERDIGRRRR
ncbi:hypothetical protein [Amycolatopsis keratiniphila]|uniref:hypothetical protein n=1 Tax=Amycolatopsis keratiniphila TaxID=129921 RepID=UPI0007AC88AF|nr:hypothetical protein [Amycolatopsis keratiniphila]OLZ58102.1 hypothetical protein BS330_12770 [Amycolatopsis keratiniphila subsp. nogabecina]SDU44077.1 hypothetical protein SAMN04489733_4290 [Amycolatopsis keratiniphila]